jgi:hypothetical protein
MAAGTIRGIEHDQEPDDTHSAIEWIRESDEICTVGIVPVAGPSDRLQQL